MFLSGCQFNLLSGGKVSGFGKENGPKSHRQRSLAGCSPWDHKESDTTEHNAHITYDSLLLVHDISRKYPEYQVSWASQICVTII